MGYIGVVIGAGIDSHFLDLLYNWYAFWPTLITWKKSLLI